jgi:arylformamidase
MERLDSEYIDLTLSVSPEMLTWPSDPGVELLPTSRISDGKAANVSELHLGSHTGTHIDPPLHFIADGTPVDLVPLEALIGPAVVADMRHVARDIGAAELDALELPPRAERILLKTTNSELWKQESPQFPESYVALTSDGADWMVEHEVRLVGIDFLSIEHRGTPGHPTHLKLLGAGIVIVEGLNLLAVEPGNYELTCLPLKLAGGDGGPSRAVLRRLV